MRRLIKKKINKIGILGGTFDPPHIGHLHISKTALKKLKLDKLVWVITKQNPLKKKPDLGVQRKAKVGFKCPAKNKKQDLSFQRETKKKNRTKPPIEKH